MIDPILHLFNCHLLDRYRKDNIIIILRYIQDSHKFVCVEAWGLHEHEVSLIRYTSSGNTPYIFALASTRWGRRRVRDEATRIYVKPVACFTRNGNDEWFRALRGDRAALHPLIYRRKAASDSHGGYREPIFRKPAPNPKERDIYRADLKYKVAWAERRRKERGSARGCGLVPIF